MSTQQTSDLPPNGTNVKDDSNNHGKRRNNRQGKFSKQKQDDKFRARTNEQERATHEAYLRRVLCIQDDEDSKPLVQVINDIQITSQPMAKPISVTTRGVGFAVAVFYDRAMSTWSAAALWSICTIHQVYRVCLWMFHYKVFLANQIQTERITLSSLEYTYMTDEVQAILRSLRIVPSAIGLILDCVGKISGDQIYHSGYCTPPQDPTERAEWLTLALNPSTLQEAVDLFSSFQAPQPVRTFFRQFCPIPGARFDANDTLTNPIDVLPPDWSPNTLRHDVHCYNVLMTRVQNRLPKHSIREYVWSGTAARSGLWSSSVAQLRIDTRFNVRRNVAPRRNPQRDARDRRSGIHDEPPNGVYEYSHCIVNGEVQEFWAHEETSHSETVVGMMSLVGEECYLATRYKLHSRYVASINPITTLYALLDAPR